MSLQQAAGNVQVQVIFKQNISDNTFAAKNMGSEIKISIIIPTYNYGRFIGDAIKSAINQSYENTEIIIVDDGSTDETKIIVSEFLKNPKIKYVYQDNCGPGQARNTGVIYSKGDCCLFLDADDMLFKNAIEKMVKRISEDNYDWVFSDAIFVDESLNFITLCSRYFCYHYHRIDSGEVVFDVLLQGGNFICMNTVLIKRAAIIGVGMFDMEPRLHQDYLMWLKVSNKYQKYSYITKPLTIIRKHDNNCGDNQKKSIHERLKLYQKMEINYYKRISNINRSWGKRYSDAYNHKLKYDLIDKKLFSAIFCLIQSVRYKPLQKTVYSIFFKGIINYGKTQISN